MTHNFYTFGLMISLSLTPYCCPASQKEKRDNEDDDKKAIKSVTCGIVHSAYPLCTPCWT